MLDLGLFGSAALRERAQSPGVAAARSVALPATPFAVLAFMGAAPAGAVTRRDTLVALIWPELDHTHARNALNQAVHQIRRAIGSDVVVSVGKQGIAIDPDLLDCDVRRFHAALEVDRFVDALAEYRGPFLDGFHLAHAPAFDSWQSAERDRLRGLARDAALSLAAREDSSGNAVASARALQRALDLEPWQESTAHRLIETLARIGDRAGALAAHESFTRRLEREYDLEPSARWADLSAQLRQDRSRSMRTVPSIAVLPMRRLSTDLEQDRLADGLTEALISDLARVPDLHVISHQSVLRYRGSGKPLSELARELGVDLVVEGGMLWAGGRVRVDAQLLRVEPEAHLWADSYERDAGDVLGLLRDLAADITDNITLTISASNAERDGRPKVDPEAFAAHLAGVHYNSMLTPDSLRRAADLFRTAIEKDPDFATPRAHLAVSMFNLIAVAALPPHGQMDALVDLADEAVRLDPKLPEAHAAQAWARLFTRNWNGALESVRAGVAVGPNHSYPWLMAAITHTTLRDFDRGVDAAFRVLSLDPWAPWAAGMVGWALHYARRDEQAVSHLRRLLDVNPGYSMALFILPKSLLITGDEAGAVDVVRQGLATLPQNAIVLGYGSYIMARIGATKDAEQLLDRLFEERSRTGWVCAHYTTVALAGLGRIDEAFAELDRVVAGESVNSYLLGIEPFLDPLRDDPRFRNALEATGLAR